MNQILLYFLSISSISAIAIYLGKLVITKTFDIGIEKYKASLIKEVEEHKSELSKISLEHQIRFTKLHDERAEKIKMLFAKIVELENALLSATFIGQQDFENDTALDEKSISTIRELIALLDINKIFFSLETIDKFENIIKESWDITFKMKRVRQTSNSPRAYSSDSDLWDEAYDKVQNEFKVLKNNLADDFRVMLGLI